MTVDSKKSINRFDKGHVTICQKTTYPVELTNVPDVTLPDLCRGNLQFFSLPPISHQITLKFSNIISV